MDLLWPRFLFLLGLIPLIIALYIWILRRRRRSAIRFSSLSLVREALPPQSSLRRHLPLALFLLALISLVIALARPVTIVSVPSGQATIILAIDVSGSMCSTDIPPNRLETAKAAALSFIQRQDRTSQIGIVAFAGYAEMILPPTSDQQALEASVESLITGRWTAIGSAILRSLATIAEVDESVAPLVNDASPGIEPTPVPRGAYAPSIVVLLTDGASNRGPMPLDAAQEAVDRGVRVYTIGYGTEAGGPLDCGRAFAGGGWFGGGSGGGRFRRGIDEPTLISIADVTGGTYYSAESADELHEVFESLPTYLITKHETTEISFALAAVGALFAVLALVLGLIWQPLP